MERTYTLAWGKQKTGKTNFKKPDKHGKKLEKQKMPLRTWVPIWWVFFFFYGKRERVAVVGLGYCCGSFPFYFRHLVRSIHPVDFVRRMNLSSILRHWNHLQLRCTGQVSVGINSFCVCNRVRISVSVSRGQVDVDFDVDVDIDVKVKWNRANVFDVIIRVYTRKTKTKPLYFKPCATVRLATMAVQHGNQRWRKMETGKKKSKMECRC